MQKPVALLLLNWNTPEHTSNCITSLLTFGNTNIFDIVVADNGSTDGSLHMLKSQFPKLIYLDNKENLGFAEGNNRAITYSINNGYSYSLIMNNDTEIDEDIISKLLIHLEEHNNAAAVQPAIYWLHNKTKIWNGKGGYNSIFGKVYHTKTGIDKTRAFYKAKWVTGCCMLVRNHVLKTTGGFNKKFFLYDEDVELSFRIRAEGYELHYLPHTKLFHEAGASSQLSTQEKEGTLSPVIHYYINRNRIWLLRKFGNPLCYPAMFIYYTPYYLALFFYFICTGKRKKINFLIKGLKDGFCTPEKVIWPSVQQNINHNT